MRGMKAAALSVTILLVLCAWAGAQGIVAPGLAPPNPSFVDYLQRQGNNIQGLARDENPGGWIPEPIQLRLRPDGVEQEKRSKSLDGPDDIVTLPSSYDLRNENRVTPVRVQSTCGTCWAFAAWGSLESNQMPAENWDFSENNLKNLHGFNIQCCSGGNRSVATAYLVRWGGPIAEYDDPYNISSCYSPEGLTARKHVQNVIYVPERTSSLDNETIKRSIMTYGGMYVILYYSGAYFNTATTAFYYGGSGEANHGVCAIGWDDNYPASNFMYAPPGNGAFLCKNEWGPWGDSGFFWVSYYDTVFGRVENACFTAEPVTNYDIIYQYDPLGWTSNAGYGTTTAWFSNVYRATSNGMIRAAGWYAPAINSSYDLYIYVNPTTTPRSGTLAASKSGTLAEAGYRTVRLDSGVVIRSGQEFTVVVRLTTPGYYWPVAIEKPYQYYSEGATASPGESYISHDGVTWSDLTDDFPNCSACLKAYVGGSGEPQPDPGAMSVSPSGGFASQGVVGGPFSPSSQVVTLTNTGEQSIGWSASKTQGWLSLSATSGTLAPGGSKSVTVSIASAAGDLSAGTYTGSVTFTNTTNGRGTTTCPISLKVSSSGGDSSSYRIIKTSLFWVSPTGHTKVSLGNDSVSGALPIPFRFDFYGTSYSSIYIGSNGLIGFANGGLNTASNVSIPKTTTPNAVLYPYWDDLDPSYGGTVTMATVGSSPNRWVVVTWMNVPHHSQFTAKLSFQVILEEGTNDIGFQYLNVAPSYSYGRGRSATIGIENQSGTKAYKWSYNTVSINNNDALIFTRN